MKRNPFHESLAAALLVLVGTACGGRSRDTGGASAEAGARANEQAGSSGQHEGDGNTAGEASGGSTGTTVVIPAIEPAVCTRFLPRWEAEASSAQTDCDTCLRFGTCTWPNATACRPGATCVERHCSSSTGAGALCSCIESCYTPALGSCLQAWSEFMACAADACAMACP